MKQFGETFLVQFPLVYLLTNLKKKGKGDIWMPTSLAIWILVLHKTFTFARKGLLGSKLIGVTTGPKCIRLLSVKGQHMAFARSIHRQAKIKINKMKIKIEIN